MWFASFGAGLAQIFLVWYFWGKQTISFHDMLVWLATVVVMETAVMKALGQECRKRGIAPDYKAMPWMFMVLVADAYDILRGSSLSEEDPLAAKSRQST